MHYSDKVFDILLKYGYNNIKCSFKGGNTMLGNFIYSNPTKLYFGEDVLESCYVIDRFI